MTPHRALAVAGAIVLAPGLLALTSADSGVDDRAVGGAASAAASQAQPAADPGDEVACAGDLLLDGEALPGDL